MIHEWLDDFFRNPVATIGLTFAVIAFGLFILVSAVMTVLWVVTAPLVWVIELIDKLRSSKVNQ